MYLCLNFLFKIQTVNVHCEICRSFCNSLIFLSIPTLNDDISWPNSLNQGRTLRRTKWTKSYIWEKRGKILLRSFFLFIEKAATRSEGKKYSCGKKGTEFGSMIFVDAAAISSFVRHRVAEGLPIGAGDTDSALTRVLAPALLLVLSVERLWWWGRQDDLSIGGERRRVRTRAWNEGPSEGS